VIAAVVFLAATCAVVCGVLPVLLGRRESVVDALRRGATPPARERLVRRVFVTGEVALAFALLVSVALVGRSLIGVLGVNPGFDARDVLVLQVSLPPAVYPGPEQVNAFYSNVGSTLDERLGAGQAAIVDEIPLSGYKNRSPVGVPGSDAGRDAVVRAASAEYFDVMRIPVIAGRPLDASDTASAPLRAVVSESLAARLFPAGQPLGRAIWLATPSRVAEIVGVVGDVTDRALDDAPTPTVYLSISQAPSNSSIVVVRSPRSHADVAAVVREVVARLDPSLPVYGVRSLDEIVRASPGIPTRRLMTAAFGGFALLALALGAVGLFGAIAHDVARRRAELALRIALGATPAQIWAATLAQAGWMLTVGLGLGGILAIWTSRTIASLFPSHATFDAVSVAGPAAVLLLTAFAAVIPSALKAARTDPLLALRSE
jgi:putative ABC transport system permease protein